MNNMKIEKFIRNNIYTCLLVIYIVATLCVIPLIGLTISLAGFGIVLLTSGVIIIIDIKENAHRYRD